MSQQEITMLCLSIIGFERLTYSQIDKLWKLIVVIGDPQGNYKLKFLDNTKDCVVTYTTDSGKEVNFKLLDENRN